MQDFFRRKERGDPIPVLPRLYCREGISQPSFQLWLQVCKSVTSICLSPTPSIYLPLVDYMKSITINVCVLCACVRSTLILVFWSHYCSLEFTNKNIYIYVYVCICAYVCLLISSIFSITSMWYVQRYKTEVWQLWLDRYTFKLNKAHSNKGFFLQCFLLSKVCTNSIS